MNWKLALKVSTLLIALSVTLYSMYLLNTGHSTDFMVSLGLGEKSQSLNWCSNRMVKLESAEPGEAWILQEVDKKWQLSVDSAEPKNVEYLDVEKWMAKYCILDIQVYRNEKILDMHSTPFANATFNDGTQAHIFILDEDLFQINEVTFRSYEFKNGIADLKALLKI
jgi:hypothetical protein